MRTEEAEAYLAKKEKAHALAMSKKKQSAPIELPTSFFRSARSPVCEHTGARGVACCTGISRAAESG
jgi:hypothetical protein